MTIRVLLNGSIYTPADPYATAILTEHGTVRWAGSDAGARSITDNTMETIDLNGRLVTPTFTRALAPVTGKTTAEILTYLTTAHHAGYHTHTLTTDPNTLQPLIEAAQQFAAPTPPPTCGSSSPTPHHTPSQKPSPTPAKPSTAPH